ILNRQTIGLGLGAVDGHLGFAAVVLLRRQRARTGDGTQADKLIRTVAYRVHLQVAADDRRRHARRRLDAVDGGRDSADGRAAGERELLGTAVARDFQRYGLTRDRATAVGDFAGLGAGDDLNGDVDLRAVRHAGRVHLQTGDG